MQNNYQIFYAGYAATIPSMYFNRVLMVSQFAQHPDEEVRKAFQSQFNYLRGEGAPNVQLIKNAVDIAGVFEIGTKPMPRLPEEYFEWIKFYVDGFEKKFEITSTEYHSFTFARKTAEVMVNLGLMQTAILLTTQSQKKTNLFSSVEKLVAEFNSITLLMFAPTVMLVRATGKHCFDELKDLIVNGGEELSQLKIASANDDNIAKFTSKVDSLLHEINLSFQTCVSALKE